jgi:hypothetical protein
MTTEFTVDRSCPALFVFDPEAANWALSSAFPAIGG